jgi:hypothetical protein
VTPDSFTPGWVGGGGVALVTYWTRDWVVWQPTGMRWQRNKSLREIEPWSSQQAIATADGVLHGPGPGSTDNVWVRGGFGHHLNDSNHKYNRTFRALSDRSYIRKKKFVLAFVLRTWHTRAPETNSTDLIFSVTFTEIFRDNTLQTWHPIQFYVSSNGKITSDVVWVSLNN